MKIFDVTKATAGDYVAIAAASYRLVTVLLPYECRVGRVVVKQVPAAESGGTAVAFTVDLLQSQAGLAADTDIPDATALPTNLDLYKVFDTKSGSSGATVKEYTPAVGGDGYLFRNVDGTQSQPVRKAYLLIRPTSSAATTRWWFSVTVASDVG